MAKADSADGKTRIVTEGELVSIEDTTTSEVIDMFSVRPQIVKAAISNNREWFAAVLDRMLPEVYLYGRTGGALREVFCQRLTKFPESLTLEECDDSSYPPTDIVAIMPDGKRVTICLLA